MCIRDSHDIEDAVTAGVLRNEDIPAEITSVLGSTKSERITSLIMAIVEHGAEMCIRDSCGGRTLFANAECIGYCTGCGHQSETGK